MHRKTKTTMSTPPQRSERSPERKKAAQRSYSPALGEWARTNYEPSPEQATAEEAERKAAEQELSDYAQRRQLERTVWSANEYVDRLEPLPSCQFILWDALRTKVPSGLHREFEHALDRQKVLPSPLAAAFNAVRMICLYLPGAHAGAEATGVPVSLLLAEVIQEQSGNEDITNPHDVFNFGARFASAEACFVALAGRFASTRELEPVISAARQGNTETYLAELRKCTFWREGLSYGHPFITIGGDGAERARIIETFGLCDLDKEPEGLG